MDKLQATTTTTTTTTTATGTLHGTSRVVSSSSSNAQDATTTRITRKGRRMARQQHHYNQQEAPHQQNQQQQTDSSEQQHQCGDEDDEQHVGLGSSIFTRPGAFHESGRPVHFSIARWNLLLLQARQGTQQQNQQQQNQQQRRHRLIDEVVFRTEVTELEVFPDENENDNDNDDDVTLAVSEHLSESNNRSRPHKRQRRLWFLLIGGLVTLLGLAGLALGLTFHRFLPNEHDDNSKEEEEEEEDSLSMAASRWVPTAVPIDLDGRDWSPPPVQQGWKTVQTRHGRFGGDRWGESIDMGGPWLALTGTHEVRVVRYDDWSEEFTISGNHLHSVRLIHQEENTLLAFVQGRQTIRIHAYQSTTQTWVPQNGPILSLLANHNHHNHHAFVIQHPTDNNNNNNNTHHNNHTDTAVSDQDWEITFMDMVFDEETQTTYVAIAIVLDDATGHAIVLQQEQEQQGHWTRRGQIVNDLSNLENLQVHLSAGAQLLVLGGRSSNNQNHQDFVHIFPFDKDNNEWMVGEPMEVDTRLLGISLVSPPQQGDVSVLAVLDYTGARVYDVSAKDGTVVRERQLLPFVLQSIFVASPDVEMILSGDGQTAVLAWIESIQLEGVSAVVVKYQDELDRWIEVGTKINVHNQATDFDAQDTVSIATTPDGNTVCLGLPTRDTQFDRHDSGSVLVFASPTQPT